MKGILWFTAALVLAFLAFWWWDATGDSSNVKCRVTDASGHTYVMDCDDVPSPFFRTVPNR